MGLLRSLSLFPDKDRQARPWWRSAPPLASGWLLMMRDAMWGARQRVFGETTGPETGRADGGGSAPPENCGGRVGLTESGRRDLNPGPSGPKPDALPDCATPRRRCEPEVSYSFAAVQTGGDAVRFDRPPRRRASSLSHSHTNGTGSRHAGTAKTWRRR